MAMGASSPVSLESSINLFDDEIDNLNKLQRKDKMNQVMANLAVVARAPAPIPLVKPEGRDGNLFIAPNPSHIMSELPSLTDEQKSIRNRLLAQIKGIPLQKQQEKLAVKPADAKASAKPENKTCNNDDDDDGKDDIKSEDEDHSTTATTTSTLSDSADSKTAVLDPEQYAVNYEHVHIAITDFADNIKIDDTHSCVQLNKIFEKLTISNDECSKLWNINNASVAKSRLATVVTYATTGSAPEDIKLKMKVITKMLMEVKDEHINDYKHALLCIASHGHVCNVMKNVAINNVYGMLTNNLSAFLESQSLQQQILKVLRDLRVLLVEQLFHRFKFCNNTHYIAGFHNTMAKQIGVVPYTDPDICYPSGGTVGDWKKNLDKRFLKTMYTKERILQFVYKEIDEKRIGYQKIVQFFEEHCAANVNKMDFLQQVIDIDTGKVGEKWLCWMLGEMGVFVVKDGEWKEIEKCWDN